jgi:hypothetical protein
MDKKELKAAGIGIVDNNVTHMIFGKGKIGVTVGGNSESESPVVLLVPIKKKKVGEPFSPDDMKKGRMSVALEFDNTESIDVLIAGLEEAKRRILYDALTKQQNEVVKTITKLEALKKKE